MKEIGKGTYVRAAFVVGFIYYIINLISIIVSKSILFFNSSQGYNYLSIVCTGIFLYLFYTSLKKGALTIRYIITMFAILVIFPFLLGIFTGRITL
ncbi:MAG: hypothetical protein JXQ23_11945 [Clostridia bacterium]|nr:hypothetical protein [Clostridia bacterium]